MGVGRGWTDFTSATNGRSGKCSIRSKAGKGTRTDLTSPNNRGSSEKAKKSSAKSSTQGVIVK